ncbi:hypothetical protein [Pseudofrankia sp. BMG5.37]|uniref:hypothetical protein n=1 Tax=Pseudofrankia sp. BMG5.37 TaxID=3050035 RepID=UPI0028957EFD|nr:hypothetical protein [Pseudofrankia sp. BMG5.37]MDT3445140.1 hypothetical protein [Pseudofrankia sp. BMG5.37]
MVDIFAASLAARPAFAWDRAGNQYVLDTDPAVIAGLRSAWAAGDDVTVPLAGALTVERRVGCLVVRDVESGAPLADILVGDGQPLVVLASGHRASWSVPTWLVWQCGFVTAGGPGSLPGRNLVLFAMDGTGIVTATRSPVVRPAGYGPRLTEAELLLLVGWLFLMVGQGGPRMAPVREALDARAFAPHLDRRSPRRTGPGGRLAARGRTARRASSAAPSEYAASR